MVSTKYFQIQFILALVPSGRIWEIIQNLHSDSEKHTEGFPRENFRSLDRIYLSFSQLDMHRTLSGTPISTKGCQRYAFAQFVFVAKCLYKDRLKRKHRDWHTA